VGKIQTYSAAGGTREKSARLFAFLKTYNMPIRAEFVVTLDWYSKIYCAKEERTKERRNEKEGVGSEMRAA